jgi:hypothetical protein
VIFKKRKVLFGVITVFTGIILFFYINNLLINTHKLTPVGEKLFDAKQIKNDVAFIFRDKYRIESSVTTFEIKKILHLVMSEKDKVRLLKAKQNENDKVLQFAITDKHIRSKDINENKEGKNIVTNQSIKFLLYFINREYDPSIKAVDLVYYPRMFNLDSNEIGTVIVIDEFKEEYQLLINEGCEGKELERKLEDKFVYYD